MNRKKAVDTRQSLKPFKASQMASAVLSYYAKNVPRGCALFVHDFYVGRILLALYINRKKG